MVRRFLPLLTIFGLAASSLVPSANIYRPSWLNLARRARVGTLNNQNHNSGTRPLSPRSSQVSSAFNGRSFSSPRSYILAPAQYSAYDLAPVASRPLIYASISPSRNYFTSTLSKRIDSGVDLKPAPTPCSLLAAAQQSNQAAVVDPSGSHLHPIYVLPPKNFQPIVYQPNSIYHPLPVMMHSNRKGGAEELWYVKGEARSPVGAPVEDDNELEHSRRRVILIPVSDNSFHPFPIYEATVKTETEKTTKPAFSGENAGNNPYNTEATEDKRRVTDTRRLKTKLPVGMTSFFLGGVRGVSGRHWLMPSEIVRQMEFMPNISPVNPESKYLPEDGYVTKQINEKPAPQPSYVTEMEEEDAKGSIAPKEKGNDDNEVSDRTDVEAAEPVRTVSLPGVKGVDGGVENGASLISYH